ncbi:hypothetical protein VNO78_16751 [Psophocarpus tetragonolobus]|uniref:Uncharacterized protein n=1 Tax=Psophocarpus tetragonolobus TaxID=3891 RepID=A0AAN9XKY2_PSOTE
MRGIPSFDGIIVLVVDLCVTSFLDRSLCLEEGCHRRELLHNLEGLFQPNAFLAFVQIRFPNFGFLFGF